jgi:hypothetical protein
MPKPKKKEAIFQLCAALIKEMQGRRRQAEIDRLLDKIRALVRNQKS